MLVLLLYSFLRVSKHCSFHLGDYETHFTDDLYDCDDNIRYTLLGSNAGSSLQTEWADIQILVGPVHVDMGIGVKARHCDQGITAAGAWMVRFCDYLTHIDQLETLLQSLNHPHCSIKTRIMAVTPLIGMAEPFGRSKQLVKLAPHPKSHEGMLFPLELRAESQIEDRMGSGTISLVKIRLPQLRLPRRKRSGPTGTALLPHGRGL